MECAIKLSNFGAPPQWNEGHKLEKTRSDSQPLRSSGKKKQHKHKLFGPDFPRTFLTLTPGRPWVKKSLPITGAAEKRTFWCGRPRFSARTSVTRSVFEKLCTKKVCVDFLAPISGHQWSIRLCVECIQRLFARACGAVEFSPFCKKTSAWKQPLAACIGKGGTCIPFLFLPLSLDYLQVMIGRARLRGRTLQGGVLGTFWKPPPLLRTPSENPSQNPFSTVKPIEDPLLRTLLRTPSPESFPEPSQNPSQNAVLPYAPFGVRPNYELQEIPRPEGGGARASPDLYLSTPQSQSIEGCVGAESIRMDDHHGKQIQTCRHRVLAGSLCAMRACM